MQAEPSFSAHMRRKRLRTYEFELARRAYAYGVDLRRSRWLTGSSIGSAFVRGVDRSWLELNAAWEEQDLRPSEQLPNADLLAQLDSLVSLLRCVRPIVRLVRQESDWPLATPMSPAHGSDPWLLLDEEALQRLPGPDRAFVLGSALGHLQCGHGVLFAAHWMAAHSTRSLRAKLVRSSMRPWTSVAAFSADRAGLLACRDVHVATEGIERGLEEVSVHPWMPRFASMEPRCRAIEDFDRSLTMARVRAAVRTDDALTGLLEELERQVLEPSTPPESQNDSAADDEVGIPPDAWSVTRCDRRLTERLGLF